MTQEFHLSITPLGQDRYLVRTEEVAPGVPLAEEQVTWPVEEWLQQSDAQAHDPLMSLLQEGGLGSSRASVNAGTSGSPAETSQLMALGQTLYSALFQGRIRDSWLAAQGVAQNRRQVLRLRLGFKDSRLQRLPWEVLYGDERPLATGTDIVFARYYVTSGLTDIAAMPTLPTEGQALQVLMVVSAPDDQERLALRQEVQQLKDELHAVDARPAGSEADGVRSLDIQLVILEQPGRAELVQALEQGQYQVLHYAGHSDISETGGDLYLVSRQTGLTERLSGEDLAGLLVNNGIRLAVFNSCRGAYTATDDAEAGWREQNLVQALVNRGVPGVIAMAERIPDNVAITFTQLLYRNFKQGYAIDLSLSRTRQGLISTYGSDQSYWMLPILYLHPEFDGYLFTGDHSHESWPEAVTPDALNSWLLNGASRDEGASRLRAPTSAEASLQDLLEEIAPAHRELEETLEDNITEVIAAEADLSDLIGTLHRDEGPSYEEDAAIVTDLIQQLSGAPIPYESPLEAPKAESLLPDQETPPLRLQDSLPAQAALPLERNTGRVVENQAEGDPERAPATSANTSLDSALQNPIGLTSRYADGASGLKSERQLHWPSPSWLVWAGLGLAGAIAAALLALFVASENRPGFVAVNSADPATGAENGSVPAGSLITGAIQAVTTNNLDVARNLLERLLDNGDFQSVQVVLDNASPTQLESAELSYITGRMGWQQLAQGSDTTSLEDVRRAWQRAVDANPRFVEAWIALGFAHYSLSDFQEAIEAWNRALVLDRQQVRDGEPGQDAIANPQALNARVGLAMTYDRLSQIAADPNEKAQLQSQAAEQYESVANENPAALSTNQLSRNWLWQPPLLTDWKTTVENLATANSKAGTTP
ncbi:MAG TPA: CHAT domain-containing protein [Trichocoleus sp.]